MGSSAHQTLIPTAHSIALSHAHKLTRSEAPQRSNNLSNKNNLWETPNEKSTRHSDQALQKHFVKDITALTTQNIKNPSSEETQQITNLAKETSMVITTLVPTNTSITHCSARILTTTLLVPKIDTSSKTYAIRKGNRIYPANSNGNRYLLLPQNNVISNNATAFNRGILLAKRLCWVDNSINITTGTSEDPIFQNLNIAGTTNLTILEICPTSTSWSSKLKILAPLSQISFPVTCRITSPMLNCSAVSIKSNKTGENTFPNLHMTIHNMDQPQTSENTLQHQQNQMTDHIPCAGIAFLVVATVLTGIKILKTIANCAARSHIRVDITPTAPCINITPSAPYNPEIFLTPSSETTQEASRLNQAMESNIRERTDTINQAVNFNQLMGFDTEDLTQDLLEEYLMSAMEMREPRNLEDVRLC